MSTYNFTCPVFTSEFEYDENASGGNCPDCKSEYVIKFDCNHSDAVLIPDFEPFLQVPLKEELEIERKWLLKGVPNLNYNKKYDIMQFYTPEKFRYRRTTDLKTGDIEYIKIKKIPVGYGRNIEKIYACDMQEFASERMKSKRCVHKTRHVYEIDSIKFEIDLMHSPNMVMMEVELKDIDSPMEIPQEVERFIIKEVTGDDAFSNYNLALEQK